MGAVCSGELPEERLAEAAERVRGLARWATSASASEAGAHAGSGADSGSASAPARAATADVTRVDIGLVAARRALTVTGAEDFTPLTEPPYVALLTPVANIAVGNETPWGVGAELQRRLPGTETAGFTGADAGREILAAAGARRVVVVVRDEHRHPWMASTLDTLLAARPDTVVVEMGVPQAPPRGALHIATHGAARVCGHAAAEVIAGR